MTGRLAKIRRLKTCVYRGKDMGKTVKLMSEGCKHGPSDEIVFFCENPERPMQVTFRHTGTGMKSCMSCEIGKFKQQ